MKILALILPLALLVGCPAPDDPLALPPTDGSAPPPGDPNAAGAGGPPGDPNAAGGGAGGAPPIPEGVVIGPNGPELKVEPGQGIKLSGEVVYTGSATGKLRLDVLKKSEGGGQGIQILHALTVEKPGPWELEVPKDLGPIIINAFIDANGNGPDATEPSATLDTLTVASEPMAGLKLELKDGGTNPFALDPNAPPPATMPAPTAGADGAPPPGGEGAPPPGGEGAPPPGNPGTPPGNTGTPPAAGEPPPAGGADAGKAAGKAGAKAKTGKSGG